MISAIIASLALAASPAPSWQVALPSPTIAPIWSSTGRYVLHAQPGKVSLILLEPGEKLLSVAAGDTERWIIGDTASGSDEARRVAILVKPVASGLSTNLVASTDRRLYRVEMTSSGRGADMLSWTYGSAQITVPLAYASGSPPWSTSDRLNFGYRIEGDRPDWRPVRAFDDGRRTYIELPAGYQSTETPPLLLIGADRKPQLVNFRRSGRYYVVDQLADRFELRVGERRQLRVSIKRVRGLSGKAR